MNNDKPYVYPSTVNDYAIELEKATKELIKLFLRINEQSETIAHDQLNKALKTIKKAKRQAPTTITN